MDSGGDIQVHDRAAIDAGQTPAEVPVWDLGTRVFHWALLVAFVDAGSTQWFLPERFLGIHLIFGYAVGALLLFRLVWGWFGSEYSRFSHLKATPRDAVRYVLDFLHRRAKPYLGHNPGGALMIVVLTITLFGIVATGMLVQAGEEKQGPFAGFVSYEIGSTARDIHALLVNVTLGLIALHVLAVILHRMLAGEPLVTAMFTGRKPRTSSLPVPSPRKARPLPALLTLAVLAVAGTAIVRAGESVAPLGVPDMPVSDAYLRECGACHDAFHPSLLPRVSWHSLMAGLKAHFGEDASLPPDAVAEIGGYLATYAAEAWDTEAGRRIAAVSPGAPLRITASPHWQRKHHRLPAADFAAAAVKSKSHCSACHADADSGRFADQAITYNEGLFR